MPAPAPDLSHIPAVPGLPLLGNTLQILRDPYAFHTGTRDRLGPLYRVRFLGHEVVAAHGIDAVEMVFLNRDGAFSNARGWEMIAPLFGGGLLLRDGAEHRTHRRMLQPAFRAEVLRRTLRLMSRRIEAEIAHWPVDRPFRFFWAIRQLTRGVAAEAFMGITDRRTSDRLGDAFLAELDATAAPIRTPLPFTRMARGLRARAFLKDHFARLIEERRQGSGHDIFSELCRLRTEDGEWLDAGTLTDHFNFLLFAAFDTSTTSVTAMAEQLALHPEWQEAMAEEVAALKGDLGFEALETMQATERVFREALRLVAPVPFVARGVLRAVEIHGVTIPPGAIVSACPGLVMMDPAIWTSPERFDPDRFAEPRTEDRRHPFAWAPFGGGAHKCLGMHFAMMEVKAFFAAFLPRFRIAARAPAEWRRLPIPRPTDGLRVTLTRDRPFQRRPGRDRSSGLTDHPHRSATRPAGSQQAPVGGD
ncbi:cytochrome P450 [Rhodobacter sp. CZR27]|uniref:cytochrome P450 n=1 Tax=Rhodobacter sp. CZR27 TaxID=2033869 RepID=UPI0012FE6C00|nr:cytochrome P450 [Rhodobacter sp. CZR27]